MAPAARPRSAGVGGGGKAGGAGGGRGEGGRKAEGARRGEKGEGVGAAGKRSTISELISRFRNAPPTDSLSRREAVKEGGVESCWWREGGREGESMAVLAEVDRNQLEGGGRESRERKKGGVGGEDDGVPGMVLAGGWGGAGGRFTMSPVKKSGAGREGRDGREGRESGEREARGTRERGSFGEGGVVGVGVGERQRPASAKDKRDRTGGGGMGAFRPLSAREGGGREGGKASALRRAAGEVVVEGEGEGGAEVLREWRRRRAVGMGAGGRRGEEEARGRGGGAVDMFVEEHGEEDEGGGGELGRTLDDADDILERWGLGIVPMCILFYSGR